MIYETKYYGVYMEYWHGYWYLSTDTGIQEYFGIEKPTQADIDQFVNTIS